MTIDAMGCQSKIAETIVAKTVDDVLCAKENQPTLCQEIAKAFDVAANGGKTVVRSHATKEKGHGREAERTDYVMPAPAAMKRRNRWAKLSSQGRWCGSVG